MKTLAVFHHYQSKTAQTVKDIDMKNTVRTNASIIPKPSKSQNGNRPELDPLIQERDKLRRFLMAQNELRRSITASNALSQLVRDFLDHKMEHGTQDDDQIIIEGFKEFCFGFDVLSKNTADRLLAAYNEMDLATPF